MMSITKHIILTLCFVPLLLNAQSDYFFERVITKNQPFEVKVYALHSDKQNFLWIGSDFGLYRYDGIEIKDFNHILNKNISSKTPVSCFYEDNGVMLIGTFGEGMIKYDRNRAAGKKIVLPPKSKTPENFIKCFKAINENVFVGTNNGIFVYDQRNDTISQHLPLQTVDVIGLEKNQINCLEYGLDKLLWIGSMGGLHCYDPVTGTYESFNHILPANSKSVWSLKISGDTLWVATNNGLVEFNLIDKRSKHHIFKSEPTQSRQLNILLSIYDDKQESLWIGTYGGGVIRFNKKKNTYSVHSNDHHDPHSISSDYVMPIIGSYDQTIWIGTEKGLNKFTDLKQKIKTFFSKDLFYEDRDDKLTLIAKGKSGSVLLGTKRGRVYRLQNDLKEITLVTSLEKENKPGEFLESLYEDREGNIWLGTTYGLQKVDKETLSVSTALTLNATITQIVEDHENTLWISTGIGSGVARYKPKANSIHFIDEPDSVKKLTYYNSHLFKSSDGCIWISGLYNLTKFNPSTKTYTHFKQLEFINSVANEDKNGNVWIGNYYGWFYKFNSNGKLLDSIKLSTQYETPTNLLIDEQNYLWVSTPNALLRIHPDTHEQRIFTTSNGMRVTGFPLYYVAIKTENNQHIFGSENGLILIEPNQFIKSGKPSPVFITNFELLNGKQNFPVQSEVKYPSEIALPYNEANFKISFAVLDLIMPEKNEFKYLLEGVNNEWIFSGTNNTATYSNLNPGTYNFRVLGSNHSGTWNEEGASIKITILPPPWKTWWAYSIYTIAFVLFLVIGRNEIVKRERLKGKIKLKELEAERYHELDAIKSRFFANISHEFRTPLTLLLGPIEKRLSATHQDQDKAELSMMHRNASRLLTLVNQLLDLSRLEAGTLKLQCRYGSLNHFIHTISNQFSSMAASKKIDFAISASEDISLYFDHDKLEKIITNLLSNAYKFTPTEGSITLALDQYAPTKIFPQGFAEIVVWDTGKGIENEHLSKIFDRFYQADSSSTRGYEGAGIGLALTKELVELHGGVISVTSVKNEGSCFAVKLPLGHTHLKPDELLAPLEESAQLETFPTDVPTPASASIDHSHLPKILIVEDNADLRTYLRNNFNGLYAVQEAGDGEQGFALAVREIPDLVISDLMMPVMDGYQLCKKIKGDEHTSHIPVILLTAKADLPSKIEGLEAGADDYLPKPFDWTELHTRIKNLIDIRKKLQEKFAQQMNVKPTEVTVLSTEDRFLKKVLAIVESNISNPGFSVEFLAAEAAMSNVQLYRKLKALTNQTPNELIRNFRLERAASLLKQHAGGVAEIAYQVGFNNLSYFAKCFKEKFGVTPSEFLQK